MTLKTRRQYADRLWHLAECLAWWPISPIAVPCVLLYCYYDWAPSKGDRPHVAWITIEALLGLVFGHFIMAYVTWVAVWDLRNFRRIQHECRVAKNLMYKRKHAERQARIAAWNHPDCNPCYALEA